jgi:hypothetical protein
LALPYLRSYQKELALKSQGVGLGVSPALAAAQRELEELRQHHQRTCQNTGLTTSSAHGREQCPSKRTSRSLASLPAHLGWHSPAVTRLLHRDVPNHHAAPEPSAASHSDPTSLVSPNTTQDNLLKLHPDLALAMLRQGQAAAGRVWLLLRHLDSRGQGWIEVAEVRQALTSRGSPRRICGWRQLRNLLAQGEGLFWCRRDDRIWLAAAARVAATLGVQRLVAQPVALPVSVLCAPIGDVRAHFYASFHSSRTPDHQHRPARPIARTTLEKLTRTSRHTLRTYERRAGVRRQSNFAVGPPSQTQQEQEQAWQRGRALFKFTDRRGLIGRPMASYSAWQLPNSYHGPHERRPRGSQKQLNHQLADLSMKGMTGNGEERGRRVVPGRLLTSSQAAPNQTSYRRRFFDSGAAAARKYGRGSQTDLYWPRPQSERRDSQIWHFMPAPAGKQKEVK